MGAGANLLKRRRMNKTIERTIEFVKQSLEGAEAGHDWFHIQRVWKNAELIASKTPCNLEIVQLAALLHDIADPKFHDGDESLALKISKDFLDSIGLATELTAEVLFIIEHISFKNKENAPLERSIELDIVQDADRLDAIGAIGIARTFNFGGFKNNAMYDPNQKPSLGMSKSEYKKSNGTTINHFYEKLLLLKDLMNTPKGKALAEQRHAFMEQFLEQFYKEWEGEDFLA